ncbi:MAG: trehalose-phosphatase [Candidatus Binatia bacterium]
MTRASGGLPSALEHWDELERRLRRGRMAAFLDYDGTLAAIVDRPELAKLSEPMRAALRALGEACPTAIVSGRARTDVATRVGLENLYYAGSHGFDIAGPGGIAFEAEPRLRPRIEAACRELARAARAIDGAIVEDKRFAASVHYRLVAEAEVAHLEAAVDRVVAADPRLRKAHGKKVFEIRPRTDWDKGRAVLWLLEALGLDGQGVVPVYVGDDETDEDAFSAIRARGIAILVADSARATAASYRLRDPGEVFELLGRLRAVAG